MSRYSDAIKLDKKEFAELEAEIAGASEEKPAKKATALLEERLSRKRCKEHLLKLVKNGTVKLTSADALYRWTYGAATVDGEKVEGVPGKKEPKVNITTAQWAKVTPAQIADILREYTTEGKAGTIVLALISRGVWRPSGEDVVYLTNERVTVEGVKVPARTRKQPSLESLLAGITVS